MKHLEEFGARLVNGNNYDLVVRHSADDLQDMLGVLRGEAGSGLIEKIDVGHADHIEANVEAFALAAAQRFALRAAHHCVPAFAEAELDQLCLQTPGAIASRQVRGANRRRKLEVLADGEMFVERVLLRHVTDVVLENVKVRKKRLSVEDNFAAGGPELSGQHL